MLSSQPDLLQQMLERERLLTAMSQRIRQTLDLSEVLNTTAAEVRTFLQSDRVAIFQFEPDWQGRVVVESVRPGCPSILNQKIHDPCFKHLWHHPYLEGRTQQIDDLQQAELDPCYRAMLEQLHVRANLVVPILQSPASNQPLDPTQRSQQDSLWGLLLVHQCTAPRQWQREDVSLLIQLASQVAVAIQQSELYEQLNRLNSTLEMQVQQRMAQLQQAFEFEATLKRITDKVRDSLDEAQILQTVVRELTLALGTASCDTAIYNTQQQVSTIVCEYIQGNVPIAKGKSIPIGVFPEYYQLLLQGEYFQFCWHNPVYVADHPVREIRDRYAVLACPIIDDQGVLGDLCLYRNGDSIYEEAEIRLVQQVANQCAIAIRQARLYHAAQTQVTELERLNYLKDDFLNTISHELRTPVANIKLAAELLEVHLHQMQLLGEGTPIDRPFEILKHETQREMNLINDLLDLSRLNANTEPLLLTTIDPAIWIHSIAESFIERAHSHQQTLNMLIPADLPPITTDLLDLERIVTELLNNACKYTPGGETITLSAGQTANRTELQISVSNSGVRIPPSEQTRIFDKFYRILNSDPWKYGGVGLGLALVQKLAQRLNGTIQVKSSDGSEAETASQPQTTFVLTVPIDLSSKSSADDPLH
ncbi:GAF domain-containing sensor histidine kinase [Leptolyngbya ohadii]|uniref:GAF domain-containing sensor histidine kinase n=1 Tax=Leptolyngbya ohadii TaxID=1962290 RepID=UPI0019D469F7|nr:GAF domain-containing protein [Leptolyngbya ohadii]